MLQKIRDLVARSFALVTAATLALTLGLATAPSAIADGGAETALTGRVVDTAGDPIAGAQVTAYARDAVLGSWGALTSTNTAADGRYELTSLPVGESFRIGFTHDDFQSTFYGGSDIVESAADMLTVAAPTALETVTLTPGARITGRVVDDAGEPVVGASVTTYVWTGAGWQDISTVDVDDAGVFTIKNLVLDGRYRLEIVGPGDSSFLPADLGGSWGSDDAAAIVTTQPATSVGDVLLTRATTISGRVTTDGTSGLPGVGVTAYTRDDDGSLVWTESASTEADGSFTIERLTPETPYILQLTPEDDAYATVYFRDTTDENAAEPVIPDAGGAQIGTVTLRMRPRLTGTVTDEGGGLVDGARVHLYAQRDTHGVVGWQQVAMTTTNGHGSYTLTAPTAGGTYRLGVDGIGDLAPAFHGGPTLAQAADVVVVPGLNEIPPVRLPVGAILVGSVTGDDGVDGVEVALYAHDDDLADWVAVAWEQTDDDGSFRFDGLAAGTSYRLRYSDARYPTIFHGGATSLDDAEQITATPGLQTLAPQPLTPAVVIPASLTGVVADDAGNPIEFAEVYAYTLVMGEWSVTHDAVTDDDGRFTIGGLTPGEYRLQLRAGGDFATIFSGPSATVDDATGYVVSTGATDIGTVTAPPAASISGTVTVDGTTGYAQGYIEAHTKTAACAWRRVGETSTNPDGTFTVPGLLGGTAYVLAVWPEGGGEPVYYPGAPTLASATPIIATIDGPPAPPMTMPGENSLTGRVVTSPDAGLAGVTVRATPVTGGTTVSAVTDVDGWYSLDRLTAGTAYTLRFTTDPALYVPVYYLNATDAAGAEPVTAVVGERELSTVTLTKVPVETTEPPTTAPPTTAPPTTRPPVTTPPPTKPPVTTPPTTAPPTTAPPTPPAPTRVTLTRPAWSRTTQTYGSTKVGSVTTTVTGLTSGTVTFKRGGTVLGKASIKNGRATLKMSRRAKVGSYAVTAHVNATSTTTAATSAKSRTFKVVKAKLKATAKISGKSFTKNTRPKVTVTLGRLNTGGYATGKVKVYVGKKVVTTVTLKSKHKGKITVTLPKKYATSIKLKAVYMGSSTVASSTSKTVTVKTRR
ncbi:carboxypeptidase regulatory-like domain-containing protein [Sanguibacter sp. HDW7]|uniref:carboxypeptidase regulatory-like domain-containing protein n=1 Tax=Sanguibacter sp. HDW7 TaxID=2714931 RepID=UPI001408D83E|nr:carboxypeptidase regulatory-like domain-containing protein [Sanguibacter sp. HDW7]QIK82327.1 hypothetical protein G7063_00880 [Sanguibacter sp. HDW7]